MSLEGDQWLEGFSGLHLSFETDGARFDVVANRRLRHNRADEIVGQD